MRLLALSDDAAANAHVVTALSLPPHNERFAVASASRVDHHRVRGRRLHDQDVFCRESVRVVGLDYAVQYNGTACSSIARRAAASRRTRPPMAPPADAGPAPDHPERAQHLRWAESTARWLPRDRTPGVMIVTPPDTNTLFLQRQFSPPRTGDTPIRA